VVKEIYAYRKRHNPYTKAYQFMLLQLGLYTIKAYTFKFWNGYQYVNDYDVYNIREVHLYNDENIVVITSF
jgi:hypothetical protein